MNDLSPAWRECRDRLAANIRPRPPKTPERLKREFAIESFFGPRSCSICDRHIECGEVSLPGISPFDEICIGCTVAFESMETGGNA